MKARILLVGPLSNGGTNTAEQAAKHAWEAHCVSLELTRMGFAVMTPFWSATPGIYQHATQIPHDAWLEASRSLLMVAAVVYKMPGTSPGVEQELSEAARWGLPVVESLAEAERWLQESWKPQRQDHFREQAQG